MQTEGHGSQDNKLFFYFSYQHAIISSAELNVVQKDD